MKPKAGAFYLAANLSGSRAQRGEESTVMTALKSEQGHGLRLQRACAEGGTGVLVRYAERVISELLVLDVLDAVSLAHNSVALAEHMSRERLKNCATAE